MKNFLIFLSLIVFSFTGKAQDTLLLKDGSKILCKLKGQDSVSVYFEVEKNDQIISTYIFKEKVQDIRYYNPNYVDTKKTKRTFEVSAGYSIPLSDYASDDNSNIDAGYAGNGFNVNLVYSYYFNKIIGVSAKVNYVNNEFKSKQFFSGISEDILMYNKNYYIMYGVLAGPIISLPVQKFTLKGNFMIGYAFLTEPVAHCKINYQGSVYNITLDDANANSLIYNTGATVKYSLNRNIDLLVNVDYLFGTFDFGKTSLMFRDPYSGTISNTIEVIRGKQKYSVLNLSAGVSLRF